MTHVFNRRGVAALIAFSGLAAPAFAQDSVSGVPGTPDALSPYGVQRVRYVLDMVPLTSSWNKAYAIGPVLKAGADPDPMFPTMLLGASSLSADQLGPQSFAPTAYSVWTTPGQGVNPDVNDTPGTVSVTGFQRQFGLAFNDLSASVTNIVGATIGQDGSNPLRLYVTRVQAMSSREDFEATPDSATLSLGSIDANGNVQVRADPFNTPDAADRIAGENILRVAIASRSAGVNRLRRPASANLSTDPGATSYIINNGSVTTNPPSSLPASLAGSAFSLILDFSNKYRANGAAGVSTHLAAAVTSHRGNPSFSTNAALGGVGTAASLARSVAGGGKVDSINLFGVTNTGAPVGPRAATLPVPITAGPFTANTSGNAVFNQYLSQVSFRGPSGQVGLGFDPSLNVPLAAAVATDPAAGEFVAVARFVAGTPTWTVAGWIGKPVLDGPSGAAVGTIIAGSPATFSMPAIDMQGNVYFVARYQPSSGPATTALIKAVNVGGAQPYPLELILAAGQSFTGANSMRTYTVRSLTLADSDSVASGAFHSASVLHGPVPGATPGGPADPFAFGGAVVNAQIQYNNGGTPEDYQAVLFIGPRASAPPACPGDADGDRMVGLADIAAIITCWSMPASCNPGADLDHSGAIDLGDIAEVISHWNETCP